MGACLLAEGVTERVERARQVGATSGSKERKTMQKLAIVVTLATALLGALATPSFAAHAGVKGEIMAHVSDLEEKLVGLAEAMPAEKFSWRPAEGIRSVSEVFMHIAGADYFILNMAGAPPPSDVDASGLEKNVTAKADVVTALKRSLAHTREAISKMSDADLNKDLKLFGRESSNQGALLAVVAHTSEHLGQLIAYARMNGVTPPWSQ